MVLKHVANMICYSVAGDSGTSPKASGSETVKDAGSKVASAVTDAGECSLAMWSIPILALQQILWPAETSLHGGMLFVTLLQICYVDLLTCVSMLAAGDKIAKSDNTPGNGAAKNGGTEGAQAASKPGKYLSRTQAVTL